MDGCEREKVAAAVSHRQADVDPLPTVESSLFQRQVSEWNGHTEPSSIDWSSAIPTFKPSVGISLRCSSLPERDVCSSICRAAGPVATSKNQTVNEAKQAMTTMKCLRNRAMLPTLDSAYPAFVRVQRQTARTASIPSSRSQGQRLLRRLRHEFRRSENASFQLAIIRCRAQTQRAIDGFSLRY